MAYTRNCMIYLTIEALAFILKEIKTNGMFQKPLFITVEHMKIILFAPCMNAFKNLLVYKIVNIANVSTPDLKNIITTNRIRA